MASLDAKNKEDIGYRFSIVMVRGMGGSREGEGRVHECPKYLDD